MSSKNGAGDQRLMGGLVNQLQGFLNDPWVGGRRIGDPYTDYIRDSLEKLRDPVTLPYNTYTYKELGTDTDVFVIEMALAGYNKNSIKVYTENDNLYISASKQDNDENKVFTHRGLTSREIKDMSFSVGKYYEVSSVEFRDGLLKVTLKKILPESLRRKEYNIS
jgi:HSP20 family molecular chaperone IbpA